MKKVVAMIKTERVFALKEHLSKLGVTVMTIADITAWAGQRKIVLQQRNPSIASPSP